MLTDYHCHILPKMDDGSQSVEMSIEMLKRLKNQGVEQVVATPHFYAHKEKSVDLFLERRQNAYESLLEKDLPDIKIHLGAEVSIVQGISNYPGIERLAIENSSLIMMEYSYYGFANWMPYEVFRMACVHRLTPIISHVHRYIEFYEKPEFEKMLQTGTLFQVNCNVFRNRKEKQILNQLRKEGYQLLFGSDSHNLKDKKLDFNLLRKKCTKDEIEKSDQFLEKYALVK